MTWQALSLCALAALFWGLGACVDKLAVGRMPPLHFFLARFYVLPILAAPFMIVFWDGNKAAVSQSGRPGVWLIFSSTVLIQLGFLFYYLALAGQEASKVVPLTSVYPLLALGLSVVFLGEGLSLGKLAGTAFIAGGVYLVAR
ncbi:MAG: hypothetical protein A3G41_05130 [Elusimicrobia bacterium RIFCSPLOWO2_12_FULL_59_9]|nr:MAG: hypothetical protein A3G41_05130 [Elusimicrobia bacterium RIFCSPLOWO2_12_FULL_59_9]